MLLTSYVFTISHLGSALQGCPKSKPLPNNQKMYLILLKSAIEIRFIRQIKEWIKHYNIIRWYYIFYA